MSNAHNAYVIAYLPLIYVYRLDYVFKFHNLQSEDRSQLVKFKILGLGQNLPNNIAVGNIPILITWRWRPQLYCLKILREQTNLRYKNHRFGNYIRPSLWSLWLLFRLMRNGISPLKGLVSGRMSTLTMPNHGQVPNFSNFDRNLIIMRSVGKSGLILNDYSSFLEVKIMRNDKYSVITDLKVALLQITIPDRLRSRLIFGLIPFLLDSKLREYFTKQTSAIFPIWHPYRLDISGKTALVSHKGPIIRQVIGPNRIFVEQNITLRSGKNLLDSEVNLIEFDQDELSQIGVWPQSAWRVHGSSELKMPASLEPEVIENATFIYAVNNLYHFLEDTLSQIEINNLQSPEKLVLLGGNLDSVLREIAISSSLAPIKLIRDEEHQIIRDLTFFYLENYRSNLAAGKEVDLAEHTNLIRVGIERINSFYPQQWCPTQKIFIIRRKGLQRQLSNYKSVQRALRESGFMFIDFQDLSLGERITLLRNCKILVGESGAGLAHAYLLDPESRVVEIRHPTMDGSLEHETLVRTRRLNYSIVKSSYASFMSRFIHGKDSFKVDLTTLIQAIEE